MPTIEQLIPLGSHTPVAVVDLLRPEHTRRFVSVLFDGLSGWVNFRAIPEAKGTGGVAHNEWCEIGPSLGDHAADFVQRCASNGRGAFLVPAPMRAHGGTRIADILSFPWLPVDMDRGDVDRNAEALRQRVGEPSLIVLSGGIADAGAAKRHLYYRLAEPLSGTEDAQFVRMRKALASLCGDNEGDSAVAKNANQILRIAGSVHQKGAPKSVQLFSYNPAAVYPTADVLRSLNLRQAAERASNVVSFNFDFSRDYPTRPGADVERALTAPILAEGKSDDGVTRFNGAGSALGHFIRNIREGRYTIEEAWQAAKDWNAATLIPPWSEERLRHDFERLLQADVTEKGAFVGPVFAPTAPDDWSFEDWSIDRFSGPAPARRWLVDGTVPAGTAGCLAAAGDAGKSMLAIWLAYIVGCTPAPSTTADSPAGMSDTPRFFGRPVVGRGAAVVLTAEDDVDEVHRRIEALDTRGLRKRGKQRVYVVPMPSAGGVRAIIQETRDGAVPTPFWQTLRARLAKIPNLALVVIDPLSSFAAADVETDNRTAATLLAMLSELAASTGAVVMFTHHVNKGAAPTSLRDARNAVRGAGALVNNGRWTLVLWEADEDTAQKVLAAIGQKERAKQAGTVYCGGLAKGNAPGQKALRYLVRNPQNGLLEDVTDAVFAGTPRQNEIDDAVYAVLMREKETDVRFTFAASKNSLEKAWGEPLRAARVKVPRDRLEDVFGRLKDRGLIAKTEAKRAGHALYEPVAGPV